jgi:hypothetical protein
MALCRPLCHHGVPGIAEVGGVIGKYESDAGAVGQTSDV